MAKIRITGKKSGYTPEGIELRVERVVYIINLKVLTSPKKFPEKMVDHRKSWTKVRHMER